MVTEPQAGRRTGSGLKTPEDRAAATPGLAVDKRRSELQGRPVLEVEIRTRPTSARCALAPQVADVSIFRPDSRYHRLVLTVHEWVAFLADVRSGRYDVSTETWL